MLIIVVWVTGSSTSSDAVLHLDQKTNVNFMVDGRHESGGQRYNPVSKSFLEIHRGN